MVRPSIAAYPYRMRAPVVRAIDQEPAHARRPHFPEAYFLFACRS